MRLIDQLVDLGQRLLLEGGFVLVALQVGLGVLQLHDVVFYDLELGFEHSCLLLWLHLSNYINSVERPYIMV